MTLIHVMDTVMAIITVVKKALTRSVFVMRAAVAAVLIQQPCDKYLQSQYRNQVADVRTTNREAKRIAMDIVFRNWPAGRT